MIYCLLIVGDGVFYLVAVAYFFRPGTHVRNFESSDEFQGQKLTGQRRDMQKTIDTCIDNLLKCLEDRYADIDDGILHATKLVNFSAWPMTFDECMYFHVLTYLSHV